MALGNDGKPELMTPRNGVKPDLGHANDMALATWTDNGTVHYYLFVIMRRDGSTPALIKLEYANDANGKPIYWEEARYTLDEEYSGVSLIQYYYDSTPGRGDMIQFLLRRGNGYYTASVRRGQSGTHSLETTYRFDVNPPPAYENYSVQAIHYENTGNGKLYVLMWGYNDDPALTQPHKNVVLVYQNAANAINNSFEPTREKVIEINNGTSTDIKFEIEGIGFPVDSSVLWFSTYEWNNIPSPNGTGLNGGICTESRAIK
jgi:hypothetical protein